MPGRRDAALLLAVGVAVLSVAALPRPALAAEGPQIEAEGADCTGGTNYPTGQTWASGGGARIASPAVVCSFTVPADSTATLRVYAYSGRRANFALDSEAPAEVYAPTASPDGRVLAWTRTDLPAGAHTFTVSEGSQFLVDSFSLDVTTTATTEPSPSPSPTSSTAALSCTADAPCHVTSVDPAPAPVCTPDAPCVYEPSPLTSTAAAVPLIALVLLGAVQMVLGLRR